MMSGWSLTDLGTSFGEIGLKEGKRSLWVVCYKTRSKPENLDKEITFISEVSQKLVLPRDPKIKFIE